MANREPITLEYLHKRLRRVPDGFIWFPRNVRNKYDKSWNARLAWHRAGGTDKRGYRQISLDGYRYLEHRIVWFWDTGAWPRNQIDHVDTYAKSDNRSCNLRAADGSQQQWSGRNSNNSTGFKGVHWHKRGQKYAAEITASYKATHLGLFPISRDAALAYDIAARLLFGEFARLNFPDEAGAPELLSKQVLTKLMAYHS